MSKEITMPKLRPEMTKGVLVSWLKEEGESFEKGEPLFEVETDKVVNQIEASDNGVLKEQIAQEGDEILCGDAVARME